MTVATDSRGARTQCVHRREFAADVSTAEDEQPVEELFQLQDRLGRPYRRLRDAGQIRECRCGAVLITTSVPRSNRASPLWVLISTVRGAMKRPVPEITVLALPTSALVGMQVTLMQVPPILSARSW